MKSILPAVIITLFAISPVLAQGGVEQEIRKLDAAEAEAVLRSDLTALDKLWAEDFTVNNPGNRISKGRAEVVKQIRAGFIKYSSFVREIEAIMLHGTTVVVLGQETVTPAANAPLAGQTVRRRFANIWIKKKGKWMLTARQASNICQD